MRSYPFARALLLVAAPALLGGAAAAAADLGQETRAVKGFHRIEINGHADVTLVQGASESVTVEALTAALPRIRTEVHGGTLIVNAPDMHSFWQLFSAPGASRAPHITIHLRELDRIEAGGTVTLDAESLSANDLRLDLAGACTLNVRELQATTLRLDGSGSIKIVIGGQVTRQKVDLAGAGTYMAAKLVSSEAVIDVSGAGTAVVNASDSLKVDISGAGKVEYLGNPQLKQSISGIGRVTRH